MNNSLKDRNNKVFHSKYKRPKKSNSQMGEVKGCGWKKKERSFAAKRVYLFFIALQQIVTSWATLNNTHLLSQSPWVRSSGTGNCVLNRPTELLSKCWPGLGARLRLRAPMQACMTVGRIHFLISIEYIALDFPISLTSEKVQSSL